MKTQSAPVLSLAEVETARRRLAHGIRVSPCHRAPALSEIAGRTIWLKRDDLQRTGSFKERGALNALLCLEPGQRACGVVAASAGNHALGLAYHAARLGVRVTVVVPDSAPDVKVSRCRSLGAQVRILGRSFEEAHQHALALAEETGATLVHPFDDAHVMAGQGTLALELLEQVPELDTVVVPVGGGGLLAGVATVVKALRPDVRVVAVEPANACGFAQSFQSGRPVVSTLRPTIADGLSVAQVGERTFATAVSRVDDVVTVTEDEIAHSMALLARRCGAVVEGAGAAALAAVLSHKAGGQRVAVPVCGRNIDARVHAAILDQHRDVRPPAATAIECAA